MHLHLVAVGRSFLRSPKLGTESRIRTPRWSFAWSRSHLFRTWWKQVNVNSGSSTSVYSTYIGWFVFELVVCRSKQTSREGSCLLDGWPACLLLTSRQRGKLHDRGIRIMTTRAQDHWCLRGLHCRNLNCISEYRRRFHCVLTRGR